MVSAESSGVPVASALAVFSWSFARRPRISQSRVLPTPLLVAAKSSELLMNSRRCRYTLSGVISLVGGMLPMSDTAACTFSPKPQTDENRIGAETSSLVGRICHHHDKRSHL